MYDKLVIKLNNIDTSVSVKKKTDYNTKTTEIQGEIPTISGLATNAAFKHKTNRIS